MEEFLVYSDIHLHNWKYGSTINAEGFNSRLVEQISVLAEIYAYADENDIQNIFCCGDIFHTHQTVHVGPLVLASKFFDSRETNGCNTYMIPGNHDMADSQGNITAISALVPFCRVLTHGMISHKDKIGFLPYTKDPDKIKTFLEDLPDDSVAFMHSGVQKVPINHRGFILNDEILDPAWIPDRVRQVFIGHYHGYYKGDKFTIPGAPMHHNFGDAGDSRGFLHVTEDKIFPIATQYSEFKIMDGTKEIRGSDVAGHYIKLTGIDSTSQEAKIFADELRHAGARTVEFEISGKVHAPEVSNQPANVTIENVVKKFIEIKNLPQDLVDLGTQIMEGRSADSIS